MSEVEVDDQVIADSLKERFLETYMKFFGSPNLDGLEFILDMDIDDDIKLTCIRGWLHLYREYLEMHNK
jgi:hypothetical protein